MEVITDLFNAAINPQLWVIGIVVGSLYALVAMGFALIYKATSIINFAQGEFVVVGAYVCLWLYGSGLPILLALVLTMIVGVIMGVVLERLVLRPMIGEPIISVIMVTIALASVLKSLVSIIWGTSPQTFSPPVFSSVPADLGFTRIPEVYLYSPGRGHILPGGVRGIFQIHPGVASACGPWPTTSRWPSQWASA